MTRNYRIHKNSPLNYIQWQLNPVHILTFHITDIDFSIIL